VYVSPLRTKPLLRYVLPSESNMQNPITLVCSDFPVLHLEMILSENAHADGNVKKDEIQGRDAEAKFR
jgi:hypothetical protein